MAESYRENCIIKYSDMPEVESPTFVDDDCDTIYNLHCRVQLKKILKSVQNATHNKHEYVFKVIDVQVLSKE